MLPTVGKLIEPGSSGVLFWQRYPTEFVLMNWRGFVTEMCPATPSRERTSCSRSCLSCVLLSSHSDCLTTKLPNHCAFSGRLHLFGRYQGYLSRRQMAAAYRAMALRNVLCYVIDCFLSGKRGARRNTNCDTIMRYDAAPVSAVLRCFYELIDAIWVKPSFIQRTRF